MQKWRIRTVCHVKTVLCAVIGFLRDITCSHSDAYHVIGLAYKFVLTLSVTQVACERSFSTLKYIENRLRNSLSQEHLETFMLMSTEKDISHSLDADMVIDRVAEKSKLLQKLLL